MIPTTQPRSVKPSIGRRLAAAVVLVPVLLVPTGCSATAARAEGPVPVTYQAFLFDVSGSVVATGAIPGYFDRAADIIGRAPDGTMIRFVIADGSSLTSPCIPRTVWLRGEGPNRTQRQDDLAADRQSALAVLGDQLRCGREKAARGSDLVGAMVAADRSVPADATQSSVIAFTDGLQASKDLTLRRPMLTDRAKIVAAVARLKSAGLLPTHLAGAVLTITDPGVGAHLTAAQAAGIITFWSVYARAARMSLAQ